MKNEEHDTIRPLAIGVVGLALLAVLVWMGRRLKELSTSDQSPLQSLVPPRCYERRTYRVFIPTPHEICPDIPTVMSNFRRHKRRFNDTYRGQSAAVIERAFLDEFAFGCEEVWAEKWTTVVCNNQVGSCELDDPGIWACDHPDIPPGVTVEEWDYPYYILDQKQYPCSGTGCLDNTGEIPDGDLELPENGGGRSTPV